jgi:hypothetical protein
LIANLSSSSSSLYQSCRCAVFCISIVLLYCFL